MRFLQVLIFSVLMSLSCSYIIMSLMIFASPNEVMTGADLLEEVAIAIGLGIAISVISLIFEVERIPFFGQLAIHFLCIVGVVFIAGYFGHWYVVSNVWTMLLVLGLIIIIYGIAWWMIRFFIRKDIDALNEVIQQRREK